MTLEMRARKKREAENALERKAGKRPERERERERERESEIEREIDFCLQMV